MTDNYGVPSTYLEREKILPNAEYVLISYAHASRDSVYPDLSALYDGGLNFWYDKELLSGDVWHETVYSTLADEHCCGIIFFFDVNCLINESGDTTGRGAVEKEIKIFEEIRKRKPDMRAFCVLNAEDESVYSIIRRAFVLCKDLSDARLKETLPEDRVKTMLESFGCDKIYILKNGDYISEIISAIEKTNPLAVTSTKSAVLDFKGIFKDSYSEVNGCTEVSFGTYPQDSSGNSVGGVENEITVLYDGRKQIVKGKRQYLFEDIKWILLEADGDSATLISKVALDGALGDAQSIERALKTFGERAFSESDAEAITELDLPDRDIIDRLGGRLGELKFSEFAEVMCDSDMGCFAWLADSSADRRDTLCDINSGIPDIDFDYTDARHGIIPMIKINLDKLRRDNNG